MVDLWAASPRFTSIMFLHRSGKSIALGGPGVCHRSEYSHQIPVGTRAACGKAVLRKVNQQVRPRPYVTLGAEGARNGAEPDLLLCDLWNILCQEPMGTESFMFPGSLALSNERN
ncbi:unnamed protein product [Arctogadus glacialis]